LKIKEEGLAFIWFKKSCNLRFSPFWINKSRRVRGNEREGMRKRKEMIKFLFCKSIFFTKDAIHNPRSKGRVLRSVSFLVDTSFIVEINLLLNSNLLDEADEV
jgi:hypothetical protein